MSAVEQVRADLEAQHDHHDVMAKHGRGCITVSGETMSRMHCQAAILELDERLKKLEQQGEQQ